MIENEFTNKFILERIHDVIDILKSIYINKKCIKCSIVFGNVCLDKLSKVLYHTEYNTLIYVHGIDSFNNNIDFFINKDYFRMKSYNDLKEYINKINIEWYV